MIFNKDTKFDAISQFKKDFFFFDKATVVLNPFTINNTNGACIIFKIKPDGSHFIWSYGTNTCSLIGASQELIDNFNMGWIMTNILHLHIPYIKVSDTEFVIYGPCAYYDDPSKNEYGNQYTFIVNKNEDNLNLIIKKSVCKR